MQDKIIQFVTERPKRALIGALFMLLLFVPGLFYIQLDYGVKVWLRESDQLLQNYDKFLETFGNDDSIVISVSRKDRQTVFNNESLVHIVELTDKFWQVPSTVRVESLSNFIYIQSSGDDFISKEFIGDSVTDSPDELKNIAMNHSQMPGFVVSKDAKSAIFNLRLKPLFDNEQPDYQPTMMALNNIKNEYQSKGYEFHTLGTAYVTDTFRAIAERDLMIMIPLLNMVIFAVLFWLFRNIRVVLVPYIIISLTIMSAMGISGYLGVKLNNLSGMVPTILIAICIADAIHILTSYFSSSVNTGIARYSLKKNFTPTLLTSITTSLGFFSLSFSDLVPIKDFGILCGLGTFLAWIYSILVITPLLETYLKIDEPVKIRQMNAMGFGDQLIGLIDRRPKLIIISFIFLIFGLGYSASQNEVNSNPFDYFSESTEISKNNNYFLKEVEGVNGLEVIIDSGEENGIHKPGFQSKVRQLQNWLEKQSYTNVTYSILDQMDEINKTINHTGPVTRELMAQYYLLYTLGLPVGQDPTHLVDSSQKSLRTRLLWNIQNSKQSLAETKRIEEKAKDLGLNAYATGQEYLFQGMNDYVVSSYFTSILLSVIGVSVVLLFVLKSLYLGFMSLLPNLLPITFGAGIMQLVDKPIDIGTVLVASVCFGIAVDDTIHFLHSFRNNSLEFDDFKTTLKKTYDQSGVAIVFTTITLVLGFGIFAFADFIPNFNFGVFSALVLVMAVVTDLLFLPALIKFFLYRKKDVSSKAA